MSTTAIPSRIAVLQLVLPGVHNPLEDVMSKSTSSRRAVLAGAITMPIAAAATVPALAEADDAELQRLSVKLDALEKEWLSETLAESLKKAGYDAFDWDGFNDELFDLVDEIQARPAQTLADLRVHARACVMQGASTWMTDDCDPRDRLFIEACCKFLGIEPITDVALAVEKRGFA